MDIVLTTIDTGDELTFVLGRFPHGGRTVTALLCSRKNPAGPAPVAFTGEDKVRRFLDENNLPSLMECGVSLRAVRAAGRDVMGWRAGEDEPLMVASDCGGFAFSECEPPQGTWEKSLPLTRLN
jgi:hypothetical protein